ncbi:SEC-C motif [Macleaya cordata]|uniref:SEC-C motif n=1 Tax=Macleaya cordata TaxID=56857 RepID=A0A200Q1I9_MACCD|nr:SEC-C motif [Macleaya cordata]
MARPPHRSLCDIYRNTIFFFSSSSSRSHQNHHHHLISPSQARSIFTTSPLDMSWMDKIKGVITGQKTPTDPSQVTSQSFTLLRFADELKTARKAGTFKQYIVGRSSEATFSDAFEKQESIIRYLGAFDNSGENLQSSHKQQAAKHCNCTIADVENALAKFTWAKGAQKKIEKLKEEGKPLPKNLAEVQKLMGSTPMDLARSNLAKSGQISRNALCPCGSKKRYKRNLSQILFTCLYSKEIS